MPLYLYSSSLNDWAPILVSTTMLSLSSVSQIEDNSETVFRAVLRSCGDHPRPALVGTVRWAIQILPDTTFDRLKIARYSCLLAFSTSMYMNTSPVQIASLPHSRLGTLPRHRDLSLRAPLIQADIGHNSHI